MISGISEVNFVMIVACFFLCNGYNIYSDDVYR